MPVPMVSVLERVHCTLYLSLHVVTCTAYGEDLPQVSCSAVVKKIQLDGPWKFIGLTPVESLDLELFFRVACVNIICPLCMPYASSVCCHVGCSFSSLCLTEYCKIFLVVFLSRIKCTIILFWTMYIIIYTVSSITKFKSLVPWRLHTSQKKHLWSCT